jgi:PAS domain S-box-containing protein
LEEADLNRFTLFCRRAVTASELSIGEFKMKRLDGEQFFGWLQAVPVRIGKAQGRHLRIAVQDITKRKEAEESTHWHSKIDPDSLILIEIRDTSHGPMFCSITNS